MKNERSKKYRILRIVRIAVQTAVFGFFLYLILGTHFSGKDYIDDVEWVFHLDPLLGLATFLASRTFFEEFALMFVTIGATLFVGRWFCGWICPLGSLHQFFSFVFKKAKWLKPKLEKTRGLSWKYAVLIFVLVGSLFTLDLAGILDPFSFFYRSFITVVLPALSVAAGAKTAALYHIGWTSLGDGMSQFIEKLAVNATFHQALFIGLTFLGVVLLNMIRERFWCRYICPTGALLGVLAKWNMVKLRVDSHKCTKCNKCTLHCETQAVPYPNEEWRPTECVYCFTCAAICPTNAVTFPVKPAPAKSKPIDLSRRKWILTTALGLVTVPFFRISPAAKRASDKLIRPPGALPENKFLASCIKCGYCLKACPTNGLQPALNEAGPEGIWTPMLVPTIGYCEYYCSLCTQVCPTGAIKELKIEEKTQVKIGSAWIKKHRCLPYALGRPCIVCEEHCPTSPKAIKLVETTVLLADGKTATQKAPVIDLDLCIGCGICENKCPVLDEPAIYCTSIGESRSEKNKLLLDVLKQA